MPTANSRHQQTLLRIESFSGSSSSFEVVPSACPAKHTNRTQKRRVRFSETVKVRKTIHVDDISEDERRAAWFSRQDFDSMKKSIACTVRMMAVGAYDDDDDEQSSRGLEYRTRAGSLRRGENKWMALSAVLNEQHHQNELQIFDDDLLREVYIEENDHCRQAALEMGLRDQRDASCQDADELDVDEEDSDDEMDYCEAYAMSSIITASPRVVTVMSSYE